MSQSRLSIMMTVLLLSAGASVADDPGTREQQSLERRSRTIEFSLKDLASQNDDDLGSIEAAPRAPERAFDGDRAELSGEDVPSAEALVRKGIDSSLHRLHRETVSRQTRESRKARIDENLDSQREDPSGQ